MAVPTIVLRADGHVDGLVRYRWVDQSGREGALWVDPATTSIWRDGPEPLGPDGFVTAAGALRRAWLPRRDGPGPGGLPDRVDWSFQEPAPTVRRQVEPVARDGRGRVVPTKHTLAERARQRGEERSSL